MPETNITTTIGSLKNEVPSDLHTGKVKKC